MLQLFHVSRYRLSIARGTRPDLHVRRLQNGRLLRARERHPCNAGQVVRVAPAVVVETVEIRGVAATAPPAAVVAPGAVLPPAAE